MKLGLLVLTLMISVGASAQTLREKRIKQEMLDRADILIAKGEALHESLKVKKKEIPDAVKIADACDLINEMYDIYPEHVKAIGGKLDLFASNTVWMKNAALSQLIYMHKQSLVCKQGKDHEYLDPSAVRKEVGNILESLEKQKKKIAKADTSYENTFFYEYEFSEDL